MDRTNIISIAKSTLEIEISELEKLKNRIDDQFAQAVEIIHSAKGKLIVVGIGKSAHVGNKIVATLNSTGTPSQFLQSFKSRMLFYASPIPAILLKLPILFLI